MRNLHDLELDGSPAEGQVAALADDIAYDNHDTDDGLRPGSSRSRSDEVPLLGTIFAEVDRLYPGVDDSRLIHEAIRRLIDRMVGDARRGIRAPHCCDRGDQRRRYAPSFGCGDQLLGDDARRERGLRRFLFERMYRHYRVNRMASKARRIVQELFRLLLAEPQCLPTEWQAQATGRRHARDGEGRRRLYRRHDRPLCARRALQTVRQVRDDVKDIFTHFRFVVVGEIEALVKAGELPADLDLSRVAVEPPRDPTHGDLSTNAAMVLGEAGEAAAARSRAKTGGAARPGERYHCG